MGAQGRCDRSLGKYFLVVDAFCNSGLGPPHQPMQSGYAGTEFHGFPSTELRDCLGLNTRHSQDPNPRKVAELDWHPLVSGKGTVGVKTGRSSDCSM